MQVSLIQISCEIKAIPIIFYCESNNSAGTNALKQTKHEISNKMIKLCYFCSNLNWMLIKLNDKCKKLTQTIQMDKGIASSPN